MKNILESLLKKSQLSIKLFAAVSILFLFNFIATDKILAQPLTATPVNSNLCGSRHCCQLLSFTIPSVGAPVTDLVIGCGTDDGSSPSCTCWDWSCSTHWQCSNGGITVTVTPTVGGGWQIHFSSMGGTGLQPGDTFQIMLCPSDESCAYHWETFSWSASDNGNPGGSGNTTINGCNDLSHLCPSCDEVDVYRPNDCYEIVCFTRHWPESDGTSNTFNVSISPGLKACNHPIDGSICDNTLKGPRMESPYDVTWSIGVITYGNPTTFAITAPPGIDLDGCQTFCFDIPTCPTGPPDQRQTHTITITNPTGTACDSTGTGFFKKTATGTGSSVSISDGDLQNYPNPLTIANAFKTMIPFEVASGGTAKITLFDETGKTVFTDAQNFDGSGKHFFYFTGSQLPAGKYFYSIESPVGVQIVYRNLLIVK